MDQHRADGEDGERGGRQGPVAHTRARGHRYAIESSSHVFAGVSFKPLCGGRQGAVAHTRARSSSLEQEAAAAAAKAGEDAIVLSTRTDDEAEMWVGEIVEAHRYMAAQPIYRYLYLHLCVCVHPRHLRLYICYTFPTLIRRYQVHGRPAHLHPRDLRRRTEGAAAPAPPAHTPPAACRLRALAGGPGPRLLR